MTVFVLALYSCVSVNDFHGDLAMKTCDWRQRGMFSTAEKCDKAGTAFVGTPIFSDIAEDRKVQKYSCGPLSID